MLAGDDDPPQDDEAAPQRKVGRKKRHAPPPAATQKPKLRRLVKRAAPFDEDYRYTGNGAEVTTPGNGSAPHVGVMDDGSVVIVTAGQITATLSADVALRVAQVIQRLQDR
jgi:hypothetical protein